jgi:hypothetical protein
MKSGFGTSLQNPCVKLVQNKGRLTETERIQPSACRKRPLILGVEEAEAPQALSFFDPGEKYDCNPQKVIDLDQTSSLIHCRSTVSMQPL